MFRPFPRRSTPAVTEPEANVVVYGTQWCAATQKVRRYLDRMGVPYTFRDMDRDPSATQRVKWWTGGYASHPTIQIGGDILVEPDVQELERALVNNGVL
jgi:mycoredoxin